MTYINLVIKDRLFTNKIVSSELDYNLKDWKNVLLKKIEW